LATTWKLEVLVQRPWSVLTHLFAHLDFWHVLMNMLVLWWMGRLFMGQHGNRRLLSVYLVGGMAGWLAYVAVLNTFPGLRGATWALGASGSVMAILAAVATTEPERQVSLMFFGRISLKYVAIGYVVLDYIMLSSGSNSGGHIAHLGGAFFGFMWARGLVQGKSLTGRMERILDFLATGRRPMRVVKSRPQPARRSARVKTDDQFNAERQENAERLNRILDKISRHGYDRLTKEEKDFLFRQSNQ
jgi:membrane associated rhomboid family serine protease